MGTVASHSGSESSLHGPQQPLGDVLITDQLARRVPRLPNYKAEAEALVLLAETLANAPGTILQKLAETALALCDAGSAGISIAESNATGDVFRWHALAGKFVPHLGNTMPRHFSPSGVMLDTSAIQLMTEPVRYFTYIAGLPHIAEVLLIPFYRGATAVGTAWVIAHDPDRHFDAEDARVMTNLSKFASAATQTLSAMRDAAAPAVTLRDTQARLEATLNGGMVGTWIWEVQDDRVFADRNLARLFGVEPGQANGGAVADYTKKILDEDRPKVSAAIAQALADKTRYEMEYRVVSPDGLLRWVVARGHVECDEKGNPVRFPGVVIDITDRKRQEEENAALYAAIESASRKKDEFLAVLSHELRGPLGSVTMAVDVLKRTKNLALSKNALGIIDRQASQLVRLVDDLLDAARISTGKLKLDRGRMDLADAIRLAIEASRPAIDMCAQALVIAMPDAPIFVNGDCARLAQVVHNLLDNASKNSERGRQIYIQWAVENNRAAVRVRNNGIGISPENMKRVFAIFEQVHPTRVSSSDGLGVGLALAKHFVELHGGTIDAFSEGLGHGAEFVVTLPLAAE